MTDSKLPEHRDEQEHQRRGAAQEAKVEISDSYPTNARGEREQDWYERTRYQILLFAIGIALFVLVLGLVLDWYIDPHTSSEKKDLVQALGLITAGVAGAVGILFTWRGQKLAREAQENYQRNTQEQLRLSRQSQEQNQQSTQSQLENAQEELRLIRQGQLTERFTRAIDQLGATDDKGEKKLEIRLGGIYALERIDKESPDRAYYGTVMEVLTAYVRENSRWEPEQDKEGAEQGVNPTPRKLPTDVSAILTILNRRQTERVPDEHRVLLDLSNAYLQAAGLVNIDLQEAWVVDANLQGAILTLANLQGAYLSRSILRRANLMQADLRRAKLTNADLRGAVLFIADLTDADLTDADLAGAYLLGANLREARGMTEKQIEWTIGSNEIDLPEDLNRPELWSKSSEEQEKILREHIGGD